MPPVYTGAQLINYLLESCHFLEFHWFKAVEYMHAYSIANNAHGKLAMLSCSHRFYGFYACAVAKSDRTPLLIRYVAKYPPWNNLIQRVI